MIPNLVMVRLPIRQQRRKTPSQRITLTPRPLQPSLPIRDQSMRTIRDIILGPLLNNRHTTKRLCELRAQVLGIALIDIDALGLGQTPEFHHVGGEYALGAAFHEFRARLREVEAVGVEDEGDALFPCLFDDSGALGICDSVLETMVPTVLPLPRRMTGFSFSFKKSSKSEPSLLETLPLLLIDCLFF